MPAVAGRCAGIYIDVHIYVIPAPITIATPARVNRSAAARRLRSDRTRSLAHLRLLVDTLRRSARTVERRTGVTNAQLFLLQRLAEEGPLTVNALAERAHTDQSTVSTVVNRLVAGRLATKLRSTADRRRVLVTVTPAGRRLVRNAPAPPLARLVLGLERLAPAEAKALARGLGALARTLELAPREAALMFEEPRARRVTR
jgi:DNA-binding MarR family transcriptional regulator